MRRCGSNFADGGHVRNVAATNSSNSAMFWPDFLHLFTSFTNRLENSTCGIESLESGVDIFETTERTFFFHCLGNDLGCFRRCLTKRRQTERQSLIESNLRIEKTNRGGSIEAEIGKNLLGFMFQLCRQTYVEICRCFLHVHIITVCVATRKAKKKPLRASWGRTTWTSRCRNR